MPLKWFNNEMNKGLLGLLLLIIEINDYQSSFLILILVHAIDNILAY